MSRTIEAITNRRKENMNERLPNETNDKPRILIVDNNSRFARSARLLLDQSGKYVACTVIDPRRALETARSFKPDLMLVDLIMPQEDGIEVEAQLEADWALHGVPIVFITRLITPEEARDGRRINGHRVVPKPTRGFDLIRVVEENLPCCSGA
jgi:two-component system OmpR family response regulator